MTAQLADLRSAGHVSYVACLVFLRTPLDPNRPSNFPKKWCLSKRTRALLLLGETAAKSCECRWSASFDQIAATQGSARCALNSNSPLEFS